MCFEHCDSNQHFHGSLGEKTAGEGVSWLRISLVSVGYILLTVSGIIPGVSGLYAQNTQTPLTS